MSYLIPNIISSSFHLKHITEPTSTHQNEEILKRVYLPMFKVSGNPNPD